MLTDIRRGAIALAAFTLLCGLLYPLLMLGVGQVAFGGAADGSLVRHNGQVVGSALVGQSFTDPRYFWGRPSAAGADGYDPTASGASNLGPTSRKLADAIKERVDALLESHPGTTAAEVPVELVTASGSGLDPDISPAAAEFQVERVARARGLDVEAVRLLVRRHTQGRELGVLGEPRVNVLALNLALDDGGGR